MPRGAITQISSEAQSASESQRMIVGGLPGEPTLTSHESAQVLELKWKQHTCPSAHWPLPEHASVAPLVHPVSIDSQVEGEPRRLQHTVVAGSHVMASHVMSGKPGAPAMLRSPPIPLVPPLPPMP